MGVYSFWQRLSHVQTHRSGEVSSPSLEHILSISRGWDGNVTRDSNRAERPRPYMQCQKLYTPDAQIKFANKSQICYNCHIIRYHLLRVKH